MCPHFLCRKTYYRRHQLDKGLKEIEHNGLPRSSSLRSRRLHIKHVFHNIKINRTHFVDAEVVNGPVYLVEFPFSIVFIHFLHKGTQSGKHPLIYLLKAILPYHILFRIKVVQVTQKEPRSISNLSIPVGKPLQNLIRQFNVSIIIT